MKSKKVNWGHVIVFIILILCMIVTLLPFVWMILTSLKTQAESICIPLKIFPEKPLFSNYAAVFTKIPFAKMYLNTAVTATVIVVVQLILCSMAAYAFGRIKFPGRNIIFGTLLAVLMVPSSFFILPQYLMIQKMGLLNTIPALFIPGLFSAFGTFLMRQFFMALPNELEDAARIDGATEYGIATKIILPLTKPAFASMGILSAMGVWNAILWPLLVLKGAEKFTLPIGLNTLLTPYGNNYDVLNAGSKFGNLPIFINFLIFQKYIIDGMTAGAVKG